MQHRRLTDLTMHFDGSGAVVLRSQAHSLGARVPPPAVAVLSMCTEPKTREQIAQVLGPQMAGLYDGLVGAGFLVPPGQESTTPTFFANFAGLEIHRRMLADEVRVDAYADAIVRAVKPGMAVMDAGTGSGLLALLAANAGARVVYAVDNSDVLELAQANIAHTGMQDVVKIVRGDFATVELPEKVDVIVSETFGAFALAEGSVPDLGAAAARHLAPGGQVVPDGVSLHIAPVGSQRLLDETAGPFGDRRGVDLTAMRSSALHRGRVVEVAPEDLLNPGAAFAALPYPSPARPSGTVSLPLTAGTLTGFVGWFDVQSGEHPMFSTAPQAPMTHWKQVYLPMEPIQVEGGADLALDVRLDPATDDRRSLDVTVAWSVGQRRGSSTWRVR